VKIYIYVGVDEINKNINNELKLFPNPFMDNTLIKYKINTQSDVLIEVFNALGEKNKCSKE
jgi:hypothetical protein